jgi:hypothetical protein
MIRPVKSFPGMSGTSVIPFLSVMRDDILRQVMLPNGTFKTTERHRLDDLNAFSLPFLLALSVRPLRIMDVAVSSGSTTIEWKSQLKAAGITCDFVATDKTPHAYKLRLLPGINALVDENRTPLHFCVFGRGISPRVKGIYAPVKFLLRKLLIAKRQPLTNKLPFSTDLHIHEDDLLLPNKPEWVAAFDVIRAANILNKAYFAEDELRVIFSRLTERLRPEGLLILARTGEHGEGNMASLIRNGKIIGRLNGGHEAENIIAL